MAIQFRSAATGFSTQSGGRVDLPGDIQVGDLVIAVQEVNTLANTAGVPAAGWTKLLTSKDSGTGGSQFAELYWKRAGAADAGASLLFPADPVSSAWKAVNVAAYYSDSAGSVVSVADAAYLGEASSTLAHASPVVSADELPAWVVTAIGKKGTTVDTIAAPTGYTLRGEPCIIASASNCGCALADMALTATGDTDGGTWSVNIANAAATTFAAILTEGEPIAPPVVPKPVFRRWSGAEWSLVG